MVHYVGEELRMQIQLIFEAAIGVISHCTYEEVIFLLMLQFLEHTNSSTMCVSKVNFRKYIENINIRRIANILSSISSDITSLFRLFTWIVLLARQM